MKVILLVSLFKPNRDTVAEDKNLSDKTKSAKLEKPGSKKNLTRKIEKRSCLSIYLVGCFYKRQKAKRYRKMLADAERKVNNHLDLQHLVEKQEFIKTALRVLFTDL